MNKEEAKTIFDAEVDRFQTMPYDDLVQSFDGDVYTKEHVGVSGSHYLFEIKTKWKNSTKSKLRFSASLRCLDESPEKTQTWNIPFLNSSISSATMSGIFTSFTRKAE
jgi:hypothetical protein